MVKKSIEPVITARTFVSMVMPWLRDIHFGDISVVVSYPASDRQRRFLQLLSDEVLLRKFLPNRHAYHFLIIDFRVEPIEEVSDLETLIMHKLKEIFPKAVSRSHTLEQTIRAILSVYRKKIVFVGMGCEALLTSQNIAIFIWITQMYRSDLFRILLFFQTNIYGEEATRVLSQTMTFDPHIHTMPLYSDEDTKQFIRHLCSLWQITVSEKLIAQIVKQCGGLFLLVKTIMRQVRDSPNYSLDGNQPDIHFSLTSFWNGFGNREKELLQAVALGKPIETIKWREELKYLRDIGVIKEAKDRYMITIPLLINYITNTSSSHQLRLVKNTIMVEDIPVDAYFSHKGRAILHYLLSHSDQLISRDQLAQIIWPKDTEKHYSDWAIDSQISRLRKQLAALGLKGILKTKRGKGVIFKGGRE
jgi:DNA-binding winged helix-turn-helix (wHTH) protein